MPDGKSGPSFWRRAARWLRPFAIVGVLIVVMAFGFSLGRDSAPTPVHERTVVNYVTETRQTTEQHALAQCQEQNTGGGAPQYGVCVEDVERAFHGR